MNIIDEIEQKIKEIELEFQRSQGLILTEDDLKCHLFRVLYPLFEHQLDTMDPQIKASPLHSEINYFDENIKLTLRPDLAILNTKDLSIFHSINYKLDKIGAKFKSPSHKQFEFGGNSIIFELKFCRDRNGINQRHIETYRKDIEKIHRLQSIINCNGINEIIGIFVIFNKTDKKVVQFNELISLQTDSLKIIYGTGKIDFSRQPDYLLRFD